MKLFASLAALTTIFSTVLASPVTVEERTNGPPVSDVYLNAVRYSGSGCPPGSVAVSFSSDRTNVLIGLSNYQAQIGPGIQPIDTRKNCLVNFDVHFPQGWTYNIFQTEYTGFVKVDAGIKGILKTEYWFTGSSQPHLFYTAAPWIGPRTEDYHLTENVAVESWAPCGFTTTLNTNTQVRLEKLPGASPSASGLITIDSQSLRVYHILHIKWRRC